MNAGNMKQCLADLGCSPDQADRILRFLEAGQLLEARRILRCLRCDLMEEMHRSQHRVDRVDWLIRETEKTAEQQKQGGKSHDENRKS